MDYRLWIDNAERDALGGARLETPNPATGETLATLARGGGADIDLAVASAKAAQARWAATDPYERARILWKAGDILLSRAAELGRVETQDTGKPITNATTIDLPRTADTFHYFAGWTTKNAGQTLPVRGPVLTYTLREPLGVVGAITPWNFPVLLAARKIAPALATGNAVVVKPPEEASLCTLELAKVLAEAGLPAGCLNVVTGVGEEAGAALVAHADVAKISFTGGTDTGKLIMRNAAGTLKKISLELGGKSPNIVFADADVEAAAKAAVSAAFYNQGELCTAGSRLLVQRSVYDRVVEAVRVGAEALRVGDPLDPATAIGPMISSEHRDRVVGWIERGVADGARLATGGRGEGWFVRPTVLAEVDMGMAVAREEIFGPVLSILAFEDDAEAVRIANDSVFGLAAGVWTRDVGRAHGMAAKLKAGTVWINTYNRFDAAAPYGGVKQSGFGRENGPAVLDEMTQLKTVWVALDR